MSNKPWIKYKTDVSMVFIGSLILVLMIFVTLHKEYGILLKFDYVGQHVPFYEQFFKLLKQGLPFWSWNQFLGTNFWSSKAYYLVGDPFAWIAYGLTFFNHNVIQSMTQIFYLKFILGFILFYGLLGFYHLSPKIKLLFSLTFILSGWNTTYIEHPVYTSFYILIPLLLIGAESFLKTKNGLVMSMAVFLLVSINFYLFWPTSLLLLVYWMVRFFNYHPFKDFIKVSFGVLIYFLLGLGLASMIWLPGVMHIMQSQRLGYQMINYTQWTTLNVASFILFTLIPRLNYVVFDNAAGIFKDDWYYFHQISLYIGLYSVMILPHIWYLIESKRERIVYTLILITCPLLLISPKIGLFFHFTYGLRYTMIMSILAILIAAQVTERIRQMKVSVVLVVQVMVILIVASIYGYFIPVVYGTELPSNLSELRMLNWALIFSFIYTTLLILIIKVKKHHVQLMNLLVVLFMLELIVQTIPVFESHNTPYQSVYELYDDPDLNAAIDYLKSYDTGFYRVEHNIKSFQFNLTNLGLVQELNTPDSYDSVFEYSITNFLKWYRQYPEGNWIFRFSEPTLFPLIDVKYAILDTTQGISIASDYYAYPLDGGRFGKYQIFVYNDMTALAYSYNDVSSYEEMVSLTQDEGIYIHDLAARMKTTLFIKDATSIDLSMFLHEGDERIYVNPTQYNSNYMEFEFNIDQSRLMYFSIPNNPGWSIYDNGERIKALDVQGGFMGLPLSAGDHIIVFKFIPPGLKTGALMVVFSAFALGVLEFLRLRKTKQKL